MLDSCLDASSVYTQVRSAQMNARQHRVICVQLRLLYITKIDELHSTFAGNLDQMMCSWGISRRNVG